ncbi:hypothetical protein HanIR_Chr14g0693411 [Helianthus annuus]|nr:hypothetical protein HanIR_Chr14g0693411 [Helianthus annuus]
MRWIRQMGRKRTGCTNNPVRFLPTPCRRFLLRRRHFIHLPKCRRKFPCRNRPRPPSPIKILHLHPTTTAKLRFRRRRHPPRRRRSTRSGPTSDPGLTHHNCPFKPVIMHF